MSILDPVMWKCKREIAVSSADAPRRSDDFLDRYAKP
jgi:hypothetical protein